MTRKLPTSSLKRKLKILGIVGVLIVLSSIVISIIAGKEIIRVNTPLTIDTVAPDIDDFSKQSIRPSNLVDVVAYFSTIDVEISRLIPMDKVITSAIYSPSNNPDPEKLVLVLISDTRPKKVLLKYSSLQEQKFYRTTFTLEDVNGRSFGVIVISKDKDNFEIVESMIKRKS